MTTGWRLNSIAKLALLLKAAMVLAPSLSSGADEPAGSPSAQPYSNAGACVAGERWSFPADFAEGYENEFKSFVSGKSSAIRAFGEAMGLRAQAKRAGEKYFAEYWVALSLYRAKLTHLAFIGFSALASKELADDTGPIQAAALDCLAEIHVSVPTLQISDAVTARLSQIPASPGRNKAASIVVRQILGEHQPSSKAEPVAKLIDSKSHDGMLANGLVAVAKNKPLEAAEQFKNFLSSGSIPKHIEQYRDSVRLFYARSLYSLGYFDDAENQYKTISKNSNELAQALSELSWAYLRNEKYPEAIGTAINLNSGGLRKTFAPEAPMVMAMAFNELCHFPDSIRAIQAMRSQYKDSFEWLREHAPKKGDGPSSYELIVQFLKKDQTTVPRRIISEWIRSPHFIGRQDEINALASRKKHVDAVQKAGTEEQFRMAKDLLAFMAELKPRYYKAREAALKRGGKLSPDVEADLKTLREKVAHYKRLKRAADPFRKFATYLDRKAPEIQSKLVAEINTEIAHKNKRMLTQLEEVADNSHFIEVEIYQGASQDMIWQNAHPDYKELAKKISDDANRGPASKDVWNWGKVEGGFSGTHEVWEDELGSFRADLYDNCSNKEKYLAIKRSETQ